MALTIQRCLIDRQLRVDTRKGAACLRVSMETGLPYAYMLVDPEEETEVVQLRAYVRDEKIPEHPGAFVGTMTYNMVTTYVFHAAPADRPKGLRARYGTSRRLG